MLRGQLGRQRRVVMEVAMSERTTYITSSNDVTTLYCTPTRTLDEQYSPHGLYALPLHVL